MNLYEGFSYKTFYYYLKDDKVFKCGKFKEQCLEDDEGKPVKKLTNEIFERIIDDRFEHDDDFLVIKTTKGCFVYGSTDQENILENLKMFSKNSSCFAFGSYRTSDVYLFGFAENAVCKRFFYTDEDNIINEGSITDYEKYHPFGYYNNDGERVNPDHKNINEDYIFEISKSIIGIDLENEDFKILDVKIYIPCEFDGIIDSNLEGLITKNLSKFGTDAIAIMLSYNKKEKTVCVSCENLLDNNVRCTIYADEIENIKDKQAIKTSFNRCLQAVANLNLNIDNKTLSSISAYLSRIDDKNSNISMISIDTEGKFMIGESQIQKKGKKIDINPYIPGKNFFYTLYEKNIDKLINLAIKHIK